MKTLFNNIRKIIPLVCFVGFIIIILYCTIYIRETCPHYKYNFQLFWSYRDAAAGGSYYFKENMLNAFLFMPLGALFPIVFRKIKWWKVIFFSLCLSVSIEFVQLITRCGFSELDDVFHNTVGSLAGFLLLKGIITVIKEEALINN